jgi:hypothetical protein
MLQKVKLTLVGSTPPQRMYSRSIYPSSVERLLMQQGVQALVTPFFKNAPFKTAFNIPFKTPYLGTCLQTITWTARKLE